MNLTSRPYSFTEQAVSFCVMRAHKTPRQAADQKRWRSWVGGGLGVRCHKNTTGLVGSCGASRAFLSSPQSCPLLLPVSLIQPVCLSPVCLPALPQHKAVLVQRRAHCTESLCVSALREKTLFMHLHFTWECSLHWSSDVWIQSNAPFCLKLIVTIFSLLKIVVSEASSKSPTKETPQKVQLKCLKK